MGFIKKITKFIEGSSIIAKWKTVDDALNSLINKTLHIFSKFLGLFSIFKIPIPKIFTKPIGQSYNPLLIIRNVLISIIGHLRYTLTVLTATDWRKQRKERSDLVKKYVQTSGTIFMVSIVLFFSSLFIYKEYKRLEDKIGRTISSFSQTPNQEKRDRPPYYQLALRTFKVDSISIPRKNFGSTSDHYKSMVIEAKIISSNIYIAQFFKKNPHYTKDKFNNTIMPVEFDFPLDKEGKVVIKEKIKNELDKLIKDLKIIGHIEEVHIISIIGS